jgi:hypothetical protein
MQYLLAVLLGSVALSALALVAVAAGGSGDGVEGHPSTASDVGLAAD